MDNLTSDGESFDLARIVRESFVADIHYRDSMVSTNDVALDLSRREDFLAPLLVLAKRQTAGRGRGANSWWSAHGGLTFSLVVDADAFKLPSDVWPRVSLTSGLSVCLALEELAPNVAALLKWPNDVHVSGRKICGVLIEIGSQSPGKLVIGIGLNVNNRLEDAPDEIRTVAVSLAEAVGRPFEMTDVLVRLLRQLERQFLRLAQGDRQLPAAWQRRCALSGRIVGVDTGQLKIRGTCEGIGDDGALILATDAGQERLFGGVIVETSGAGM